MPGEGGGHEVGLPARGAPQRPVDGREVQQHVGERGDEQRDDAHYPAGDHDPGAAPQAGHTRVPAPLGHGAAQDGNDAGE